MPDNRPLTHLAAAIIATIAFVVSLTVWPALVRERGTCDWFPAVSVAAAAGSLYLLLTALSAGWSWYTGNCLRFRNVAPDVLLALVAGWFIGRGIEARSLLAGLGFLLPSLATTAAVMIVVRLMPTRRNQPGETNLAVQPAGRARWIEIARIAAAAIAAIALVNLELQELPSAKPWSENSHVGQAGRLSHVKSPQCVALALPVSVL
jgi:hypothetical protein